MRFSGILATSAAAALCLASAVQGQAQPPAPAPAPAWNPQPWRDDLAEMRAAMAAKYANIEWLTGERELDLDNLWAQADRAIRGAGSDAGAARIFDRVIERIGDGHVGISWPRPPAPKSAEPAAPAPPPTTESFCRAIGYGGSTPGLAPAVAGYTALPNSEVLPAGTATIGGVRAGFLRIGIFQPQGYPPLCLDAVKALGIPVDKTCDEDCKNRIVTHAYRAIGDAMMDRLVRLKAAGAEVLVVDLTGNGGGSEWTEAAARMLSRRPLQSAPIGFVRGAHWAGIWGRLAEQLRKETAQAAGEDRTRLAAWAAEAEAAKAEAERSCPPGGGACPWLGRAGHATGLVGKLPAGGLDGKPWAVHLFNPAQHNYRDGVWEGPVVVLTDQETWSAAEQFAALLQDNRAAIILGARTGGSGCGHTWGGTPTKLTNSGATLRLPDCVRFRADGSNEVRGILPDVAISWRANDGSAFRARLLEAALPEAARRARALHAEQAAR